jgi:hypothetical protein
MSMSDSSQSKFSPRTGSAQQRPVTYLSIGQILRCHVAGKSMETGIQFPFHHCGGLAPDSQREDGLLLLLKLFIAFR